MSELSTFGAHARAMSTTEHVPECLGENPVHPHPALGWIHPDPACPGCVTDADRALWARLADEVDAYLAPEPEETLPV
jgi:hypothetical protein